MENIVLNSNMVIDRTQLRKKQRNDSKQIIKSRRRQFEVFVITRSRNIVKLVIDLISVITK